MTVFDGVHPVAKTIDHVSACIGRTLSTAFSESRRGPLKDTRGAQTDVVFLRVLGRREENRHAEPFVLRLSLRIAQGRLRRSVVKADIARSVRWAARRSGGFKSL